MMSRLTRQSLILAAVLSVVGAAPVLGAGSPSPEADGTATGTWFDGLEAGVCFDTAADGSIDYTVPALVVPCDGPHVIEIGARESLGDGAFPTGDLGAISQAACAPAYEAFLGRPIGSSGLFPGQIWPDASDWSKGIHDVLCLVSGYEPLVGTAASGGLTAPGETLAVYRQPGEVPELWLADGGTGEMVRRVGDDALSLVRGAPSWTADGTAVTATVAKGEDDVDAWLLPIDGSAPEELVAGPGKQDGADISPDGTTLAFISNDGLPEYEVFTRPLVGGAATRLTEHEGRDASPQWSPDGTRLLFRRVSNDVSDIWVMHADGTNQQQLTDDGAGKYDPRWSPDGTRVLFTSYDGGDYDIWIMNADGTDQRLLTDHPANDEYPTWSSDGELIAFQSSRYGGPTIWLMRADGSEASLLSSEQPTGSPMFAPVEVAVPAT